MKLQHELANSVATVIRLAGVVGVKVSITIEPLVLQPAQIPESVPTQPKVPSEPLRLVHTLEHELCVALSKTPTQSMSLREFADSRGEPIASIRGKMRGAGRAEGTVIDEFYTRYDVQNDDGSKTRAYKLTEQGRNYVKAWKNRQN